MKKERHKKQTRDKNENKKEHVAEYFEVKLISSCFYFTFTIFYLCHFSNDELVPQYTAHACFE